MKILARPSWFRSLKKFSTAEIAEINAAIALLPEAFGKPHIHAGLGIRKLHPSIFELRADLDTRVLLAFESGDLVLIIAGNHDQIRTWLKANT